MCARRLSSHSDWSVLWSGLINATLIVQMQHDWIALQDPFPSPLLGTVQSNCTHSQNKTEHTAVVSLFCFMHTHYKCTHKVPTNCYPFNNLRCCIGNTSFFLLLLLNWMFLWITCHNLAIINIKRYKHIHIYSLFSFFSHYYETHGNWMHVSLFLLVFRWIEREIVIIFHTYLVTILFFLFEGGLQMDCMLNNELLFFKVLASTFGESIQIRYVTFGS